MLSEQDKHFLDDLQQWQYQPFSEEGSFCLNPTFCTADKPLGIRHVNDMRDVLKVVAEARSGFDPDYETYVWLGEDGHGRDGAPYRIRDILDEMEMYAKELLNLEIQIEGYLKKSH